MDANSNQSTSSDSGEHDTEPSEPTQYEGGSPLTDNDESEQVNSLGTTRRRVLMLLGVLGVGTYATTGTAAAQTDHNHMTETWSGDPGTPGFTIDVGSNTDRAYVGATAHPEGVAVQGVAHDDSGRNKGIEGKTKSSDGIGLLGNATNTSGGAKGLEGRSAAKFGTGVVGIAKHDSGQTKGVRGIAASQSGYGVQGINTASSGTTYGVRGRVESPDGYGLYTEDAARVDGDLTVGSGIRTDPIVIGNGASTGSNSILIGVGSASSDNSVIIGDNTDVSGNDNTVVVGQSNTPGGPGEVIIGHGNDGAPSATTVGRNASNEQRSVAIGLNTNAANRNSVAIGAYANENASATGDGWSGIRVAIGSRASAGSRGTALGPGAGERGTPGSHTVTVGNEASSSANYSIAIGDQREIGGGSSNPEPMIKSGADGAVAIGTSVEVGTAQVARIGTSTSSNPTPRQLVWQGSEQLADAEYIPNELTVFIDESSGGFVIKGKDSNGNIRQATIKW